MEHKITEIRGIGASTARLLAQRGLTSVTDVANAGVDRIAAIPGFGPVRAARVIEAATALIAEAANLIEVLPVRSGPKDEKRDGDAKKSKRTNKKDKKKSNKKIKKKDKKNKKQAKKKSKKSKKK